jgi:hypothetical protein
MADNKLVAARDGVLVKVGNTIVSLYRGGAAPEGADERHVALLKERKLLVESDDDQNAPVEDHSDTVPAKSATREEWDAYAKSQGLSDEDIAGYSSKADLQAHFGVS